MIIIYILQHLIGFVYMKVEQTLAVLIKTFIFINLNYKKTYDIMNAELIKDSI